VPAGDSLAIVETVLDLPRLSLWTYSVSLDTVTRRDSSATGAGCTEEEEEEEEAGDKSGDDCTCTFLLPPKKPPQLPEVEDDDDDAAVVFTPGEGLTMTLTVGGEVELAAFALVAGGVERAALKLAPANATVCAARSRMWAA